MKYLLCAIISLTMTRVYCSFVRFSPGSSNLLHSSILSNIDDEKLVDVQKYIAAPLSHVQTSTGAIHGHLRTVFAAPESYLGCQALRLNSFLFVAACSDRLLMRRLEPAAVSRVFEVDVKGKIKAFSLGRHHIAVLAEKCVKLFSQTFPISHSAAIPVDSSQYSAILSDKASVYLLGEKCVVHKYSIAHHSLAVLEVDRDRPCQLYAVGSQVFAAVDREDEVAIVALDTLRMFRKVRGKLHHFHSRRDSAFLATDQDFCIHDLRPELACRGASLGAAKVVHEFGGSLFSLGVGRLELLIPGEAKPRLLDTRTDLVACIEFSCIFSDGTVKKLDTLFVRVGSQSLSIQAVDVDQRKYDLRISVVGLSEASAAHIEVRLHQFEAGAQANVSVPFDFDELGPADRGLKPSNFRARLYANATEPVRYSCIYTIWSKDAFPALPNRYSAISRMHDGGLAVRHLDGKLSYFSSRVFALSLATGPDHTMLLLDEHSLSSDYSLVDMLQVRSQDMHMPVLVLATSRHETLLQLCEDTYVERYTRAKLDTVLARFDFLVRFGGFANSSATGARFVGVGHYRSDSTEHMDLVLFRVDRLRVLDHPLVLRVADSSSLAYRHYDIRAYSAAAFDRHSLVRFVYGCSILLQHIRISDDDSIEEVYHRPFDLASHALLHLSPTHLFLKSRQALVIVWIGDGRFDASYRLPEDTEVEPCGDTLCLFNQADHHLTYVAHKHDRVSFEVLALPHLVGEVFFQLSEGRLVYGLRNGTGDIMSSYLASPADSLHVQDFDYKNTSLQFANERSSIHLDLFLEDAPTAVSAVKVNSNFSIEVAASDQLFNLSIYPATKSLSILELVDKPEPCPVERGCQLLGFVGELLITKCAADTLKYFHQNGSTHSSYTYKASVVKSKAVRLLDSIYSVHVTSNQTYLAVHNQSLLLHEHRDGQEHLISASGDAVSVFVCHRAAPLLKCSQFEYSAEKRLTETQLQDTQLDRPAVYSKLAKHENTLVYLSATKGKKYLDLVYMAGNNTYVYMHPIDLAVPAVVACSQSEALLHCSFAAETFIHSIALSLPGRSHRSFNTSIPAAYAIQALETQGAATVASIASKFNSYTLAFNATRLYHLPTAAASRVLLEGDWLFQTSENQTARHKLRTHRVFSGLASAADLSRYHLVVSRLQAEALDILFRVPLSQLYKPVSGLSSKSLFHYLTTALLFLAILAIFFSAVYFFFRLRNRRRRRRQARAEASRTQPQSQESSANMLLPG